MKYILLLLLFNVGTYISVYAQDDFIIQFNDTTFDISLNKKYEVNINGENISFIVKGKDTLNFHDEFFNFKYPSEYKISKTSIDEGIDQIMLITAEGSGFIIQKYTTINPTMINEMMLSEVTKESVSYGYEMTREDYKRMLLPKVEVEVSKAVLSYKDDISVYEVATIGRKDEGILIMTMDTNVGSKGKEIIDLMWNTLTLNSK